MMNDSTHMYMDETMYTHTCVCNLLTPIPLEDEKPKMAILLS